MNTKKAFSFENESDPLLYDKHKMSLSPKFIAIHLTVTKESDTHD